MRRTGSDKTFRGVGSIAQRERRAAEDGEGERQGNGDAHDDAPEAVAAPRNDRPAPVFDAFFAAPPSGSAPKAVWGKAAAEH